MWLFIRSPDTSGRAGIVTFKFTPDGGGPILTQTVPLQVVKIRVEAEALWPSNRVRHVFGPKERFTITSNPQVVLSVNAGSYASVDGATVTAPDRGGAFNVEASIGQFVCSLNFNCIVPTVLRGGSPREWFPHEWNTIVGAPLAIGESGVAMHIDTWLEPQNVSFCHLRLFEGFAPTSNRTGWCLDLDVFPEELFQHGAEAGAGSGALNASFGISGSNNLTEGGDYIASLLGYRHSYYAGSYQLAIPLKWFAEGGGTTNNLPNNLQSVWIYSNGTMRIQKNGVIWERDVDGTCRTITE